MIARVLTIIFLQNNKPCVSSLAVFFGQQRAGREGVLLCTDNNRGGIESKIGQATYVISPELSVLLPPSAATCSIYYGQRAVHIDEGLLDLPEQVV